MPSEEGEDQAAEDAAAAGTIGASVGNAKRKKAFRFLPTDGVLLLKEALKHTPWSAGHGETLASWARLSSDLKVVLVTCTADAKACRRRFTALVEAFRREEVASLRASGTTEEYAEREQLLTDIMTSVDAHTQEKAYKTEKEKREAERREAASAEVVRQAMEGLQSSRSHDSDSEDIPTPPPKRQKRTSTEVITDYLENKAAERDSTAGGGRKKLELDERRLEQDRERNAKFMEMMSSQMSMMAKLIETVANAHN